VRKRKSRSSAAEVTLIDNQDGTHALSPCGFSKFAEGIDYVLQQLVPKTLPVKRSNADAGHML
jgi:hypothetical protein